MRDKDFLRVYVLGAVCELKAYILGHLDCVISEIKQVLLLVAESLP